VSGDLRPTRDADFNRKIAKPASSQVVRFFRYTYMSISALLMLIIFVTLR